MRLYIRAVIVTLIAALAIGFGFFKWRGHSQISEGKERIDLIDQMEKNGVFDFTGKTVTGQEVRLSDSKGKIVIVNFWASWCAPCVEEIPSMIKLVNEMKGDLVLYAVSEDSNREEVDTFLRAFTGIENKNIHVILDLDRTIGKLYQADRLPESYVVGKDLKLARKVIGSIDWASEDAISFMRHLKDKP